MTTIERYIRFRLYFIFIFSLLLNILLLYLQIGGQETHSLELASQQQASRKLLKATAKIYAERSKTYQLKVDSLQRILDEQKVIISDAKKRTKKIQTHIREAKKNLSENKPLEDSARKQITETLIHVSRELDTKDSLMEQQQVVYENIIAEKDNLIAACDSAFTTVETELQKQVLVNEELTKQLKKKERKEKRKQFFNRALTGTAILVGTILLITQ